MPELPEVETIRLGLAMLLPGKVIKDVWQNWPKSFPNSKPDVDNFLLGAKILEVKRRAKVLLIELSSKYSLVIHLKMTGQLVYVAKNARFGAGHPGDSLIGELPDKSTRVIFDFEDSKLYFNDQRKFGWIKMIPTSVLDELVTGSVFEADARKQRAVEQAVQNSTAREPRSDDEVAAQKRRLQAELGSAEGRRVTEAVVDFMKKLGPEPLAANFKSKDFVERFRKRPNALIKAALLDQSVLAGVGNIYADESLFAAKIHPAERVNKISDARLVQLYKDLVAVLKLSIKKGGSSDKNYVNAEGKKGSYLTFAKVFRLNGKPCPRHPDTLIEKIRVAGRGTHICPRCQRIPK